MAEIGIAVGLIGFAAFAGRMIISADHQVLEQRGRLSQAAVGAQVRLTSLRHCAPAELFALARSGAR